MRCWLNPHSGDWTFLPDRRYLTLRAGCAGSRTEGVAMVIGYIMLTVLWIVIGIFGLAAVLFIFRSAGR